MRILHVTKKYPNALGGDATGSSNLEREQTKLEHKVFILTTNCDEILDKENVIKFGLKSNYQDWDNLSWKRFISTWILIFSAFSLIKRIKPDIVHSHSAELGFILSFPCKYYGVPIINQCRGVSFPYPQNTLIRRIIEKFCLKYGKFNKIITVDANSLKFFEEENIKNVIYLPNGINLSEFNLKNSKEKEGFIFVGRVEEEKGIGDLIEAVKILNKKGTKFKIKLVGDGKHIEFYKDKIRRLDLGDYFQFLGRLNHKETIKNYFKSKIFILPSHQEGFPNTMLEAWGASLPVIITNVGGISKVCKNKENSIIIPPKNPKKIAEAMLTLIRNRRLIEKMGKNGRKLVERKYNWVKVSNELIKLYQGLDYNDK